MQQAVPQPEVPASSREWTRAAVAASLDHSLLKPASTDAELRAGCELAVRLGVASVCILPSALTTCVEVLSGSPVQPSTTIGFPHGAHLPEVKLMEARKALEQGATELDMVIHIGKARSGELGYVRDEVGALVELTHAAGQKLKVIFECCYLDDSTKVQLCDLCSDLQVDWVKTSTGFGSGGATVADVELMRAHSRGKVQVKASGGIRSRDTALCFLQLGATRIGTSASQAILDAMP